jgi:ferritin-like metal-binding protein YciE
MTQSSMSMKMTDLQDLYLEQLRDVYSAETQLLDALPKMAQAASSPELRQGFEMHLGQTRQQAQRLKQIVPGTDCSGPGRRAGRPHLQGDAGPDGRG